MLALHALLGAKAQGGAGGMEEFPKTISCHPDNKPARQGMWIKREGGWPCDFQHADVSLRVCAYPSLDVMVSTFQIISSARLVYKGVELFCIIMKLGFQVPAYGRDLTFKAAFLQL